MHSPMYEMLSLPVPVRFLINIDFPPIVSQHPNSLQGQCCELWSISLLDCHSWWFSLGVGERNLRPGFLALTMRLLIEHLSCELPLQLGFGESIQQQVGPWKLSLPGALHQCLLFCSIR
jgi:hypothetical protein